MSPAANYNWIPSNIWVGVGRMDENQVKFPLRPVYDRKGIEFHQALGVAISPDRSREVLSTVDGHGSVTSGNRAFD